MKKILTSLLIREMQIQTTRYNFTPTSRARIKKPSNVNCWQGYGELEPSHIAGANVKWCSYFGQESGSSSDD